MTSVTSNADVAAKVQEILAATPPSGLTVASLPVLSSLLQPRQEITSLWEALDCLSPPALGAGSLHPIPEEVMPVLTALPTSSKGEDYIQVVEDGSICLSCPLRPTSPSQVTLTPWSVVLQGTQESSSPEVKSVSQYWWDLPWKSEKKLVKPRRVVATKRFYPPLDQVSLRATWWGYQIFLPHSIMLELGSDVQPIASALTSFSTALTFMAAHVPPALALLPGVALLKAILPVLAGICSALAWTWTTFGKYDKGDGIVISATWVIPIAIVPSTLDPKKWPSAPPPASAPISSPLAAVSSDKGDVSAGATIQISTPKKLGFLAQRKAKKLSISA